MDEYCCGLRGDGYAHLPRAPLLLAKRHAPPRAGLAEWVAKMTNSEFVPCRTMFIAALGDPKALLRAAHARGRARSSRRTTRSRAQASSGSGAADWGLWRIDPGPRGVLLKDFARDLEGGTAPARWAFDADDWWVEEYGRIMEKPEFRCPPAGTSSRATAR